MMVYGLDNTTSNTDKLFNLVCLYGKITKAKDFQTIILIDDNEQKKVKHKNNLQAMWRE